MGDNFLGLVATLLGLIGTASGIVVGWRTATRQMESNQRADRSQAIDDLDQVRKALMEEIGRLSAKLDDLEQENEQLRREVQDLRTENESLKRRVSELETQLRQLDHLKSNA